MEILLLFTSFTVTSVSYTHLDVYKRQVYGDIESVSGAASQCNSGGKGIVYPPQYVSLQAEMCIRDRVIIATVSGDLHDIGKNLVAMMIESEIGRASCRERV